MNYEIEVEDLVRELNNHSCIEVHMSCMIIMKLRYLLRKCKYEKLERLILLSRKALYSKELKSTNYRLNCKVFQDVIKFCTTTRE
jgi:hypothetical protein